MNKEKLIAFKEYLNDEIKQAKPYFKRVKRLTLYNNNVVQRFDRNKGKWVDRTEFEYKEPKQMTLNGNADLDMITNHQYDL